MTLRALQSAANNQGSQAPMTWKALNAADAGMGSPDIDYDRFNARWEDPEQGPVLKQLVDRFDSSGLIIKTKEREKPQVGSKHRESEISRMAKRAALKKRQIG